MEYMSTQQAADKWKVSVRNVQRLLLQERVEGAKRYGRYWMIPSNAEKPADPRTAKKVMKSMKHLLPCRMPGIVMTTLYNKPGSADDVLKSLYDNQDAYLLMKAELLYLRGNYKESQDILQNLVIHTECFDTRLGCLMGIMNTCLYTGDYFLWNKARKEISGMSYSNDAEHAEIELCIAAAGCALYDKQSYPEWLKAGRFEQLPLDCFPSARYYYLKYLIISHEKIEQKSILYPLCSQTMAEGAVAAELYQRLQAAVIFHDYCMMDDCIYNLNRAFDLALCDKLYAPLAEARRELGMIFDQMLRKRDSKAFQAVDQLWNQLMASWTILYESKTKREFSHNLTLRESEVMKYAAMNMTNDEIAAVMNLSSGTVKNYISSALNKTELHDRKQFAKYLTMS